MGNVLGGKKLKWSLNREINELFRVRFLYYFDLYDFLDIFVLDFSVLRMKVNP